MVVKDLDYYKILPYTIILERHDDQGTYWVARVAELPHCLIHGDSPEEAVKEIEEVKLDWIQSNLEDGLPIPEPVPYKCSGHIRLRIPPSLHKLLRDRAIVEDVSLNQYMTSALASSVGIDTVKEEKAPSKVGVREKRARYRSSK
ncbi:MAG: type II toxin-antitoxin system HicB family antitoxin [Chloroflexi bacterium]|nr:type II toxin-antitoxin system HicB family antitoxin [Chloroflexota bacterium]